VRAIVEHPFLIIWSLFGCCKVSNRRIAKNESRVEAHSELVNL
jgi:hypothetical protein